MAEQGDSMLSKFFSRIFGNKNDEAQRYNSLSPASQQRAEEPKFNLPETAEEYRKELAEVAALAASLKIEAEMYNQQANRLLTAEGTPAQKELNRREAQGPRGLAGYLTDCVKMIARGEGSRGYGLGDGRKIVFSSRVAIERAVRQKEMQKIAHQGEILCQTWDESEVAKSGSSLTPSFPNKKERRLVRFDGRVFLVQLEWRARTNEVPHPSGGWYGGAWMEYVPTGEFEPPTVSWATESVAQMTEQELRTIA